MRQRLAPLLPISLIILLAACAVHPEQSEVPVVPQGFAFDFSDNMSDAQSGAQSESEEPTEQQLRELADEQSYELPALADSVLELGFKLVGTPYRYGGSSTKTGFDCSGFVGFLFRKEAGIDLPRSTREMINLDAPKIARSDLEPGDVVFFNNRGRGRVSHTGIYIGNDQFIHSASRRSGGVRVDSLDDKYWRTSFMQAKRVLALAHDSSAVPTHH
ncbi:peptidase P60 [Stutzerimonas stutzeri]|uniref:Peptidase P60 n=1 Tax=Stutzerimonas stutzeri TaxID=316 RepID=W8QXI5_STUST|nr:C40 family peptidase [Stutzerimonas stutzeri]AHL74984.1 peptidase P60 [Stutzerimonas stutzeri]MCQ4331310.1 C40 family peptidase [Stutzerimonas stutzeri]